MKIGFIGAGNMASAIISGLVAKEFINPQDIAVYDVAQEQMEKAVDLYSVYAAASQDELITSCEFIVLAVKPVYMKTILKQAALLANKKKFISIATGWSVKKIVTMLNTTSAGVLRCMPNTPLMVGEGFTTICTDTSFSKEDISWVTALFETLGTVALLPETLFDAVIAVAG